MTRKPAKKAAKARKPAKAKRPRGRPSRRSPAVEQAICARLAKGEPLAAICRDEAMPAWRTVYDWVEQDQAFAADIARAREEGEEAIASDCLGIADDAGNDYRMGEKGLLVDHDHIQRSKLRIDTRLKLLAKWNPKKWGERQTIEHDVSDNLADRLKAARERARNR